MGKSCRIAIFGFLCAASLLALPVSADLIAPAITRKDKGENMPEKTRGPDVAVVREQMYSLFRPDGAASILDIGCGDGYDLVRLGNRPGRLDPV